MSKLRVAFDTNAFNPQNFPVLDQSPMRALCARGRIVAVYSGPFLEEMAWAYRREKVRADLLDRWLPFIVETSSHFHDDTSTIWQRELVQGAGLKVSTLMSSSKRQNLIETLSQDPRDGSWAFAIDADPDHQRDLERLRAQREMSKDIRAEVAQSIKLRGLGNSDRSSHDRTRRQLEISLGREMIEQHIAPTNGRAVADRWQRAPQSYRYFTQFVVNMTYKQLLFATDGNAAIDVNAQPDLDLMTFLLDADVFVTNERGSPDGPLTTFGVRVGR